MKPWYLVFGVLLVDQITKVLVVKNLALNVEYVEVVGSFVGLRYVENTGMAFGLFSDVSKSIKDVLFTLLTGIAIVMIIVLYRRIEKTQLVMRYAFALILGGAFGNITDKLFGYIVFHGEWHVLYGRVVDFFDLGVGDYRWPTFNVADIAITVGLVILFVKSFLTREHDIFTCKKRSC